MNDWTSSYSHQERSSNFSTSLLKCEYVSLFLFLPVPCGLRDLSPCSGTEPGPQQWKCQILTTRPPGNSYKLCISLCLHKWKPMWENTVVLKIYLLFIFYLFSIKDIELNVAQTVKNPPAIRETWVWSLDWEDPLEKGTVTHSSIPAWKIPWTEEPGEL